jgi:hypothetical protein
MPPGKTDRSEGCGHHRYFILCGVLYRRWPVLSDLDDTSQLLYDLAGLAQSKKVFGICHVELLTVNILVCS